MVDVDGAAVVEHVQCAACLIDELWESPGELGELGGESVEVAVVEVAGVHRGVVGGAHGLGGDGERSDRAGWFSRWAWLVGCGAHRRGPVGGGALRRTPVAGSGRLDMGLPHVEVDDVGEWDGPGGAAWDASFADVAAFEDDDAVVGGDGVEVGVEGLVAVGGLQRDDLAGCRVEEVGEEFGVGSRDADADGWDVVVAVHRFTLTSMVMISSR